MILIVETNFLLEVARIQAEADACKLIIERCKKDELKLVVPACCFMEAWHVWRSDIKSLREHQNKLGELRSKIKTRAPYAGLSNQLQAITREFVERIESEKDMIANVQKNLLEVAQIIPLEQKALEMLLEFQQLSLLEPHDCAVLASVMNYCRENSGTATKVFLTSDEKDFCKPAIEQLLDSVACKMSNSFEAASRLISQ